MPGFPTNYPYNLVYVSTFDYVFWLIFMVNVGKYTSRMDATSMGYGFENSYCPPDGSFLPG